MGPGPTTPALPPLGGTLSSCHERHASPPPSLPSGPQELTADQETCPCVADDDGF